MSIADPGAYTPPVDDYAFLLGEAFGEDLVARASEGALTAEDAVDALAAAGEFAAEVFAPLDRVGDVQGSRLVDGGVQTPEGFKEAYRAFVDAGWVTAGQPEAVGGDGLPVSIQQALTEFWNASNAAFALGTQLSHGMIHSLEARTAEDDPLRARYLAKLVSGEWTGTMNLTEPQAGSDLGAITTTARQNPDGTWAISGQKIFITWGDHDIAPNIAHLVLARTEGAPEGHRGLSLFVAPKYLVNEDGSLGERNSIETVGVEHKLGIHASPTCVLQFDGARAEMVGEINTGLEGMFVMMNSARIGIGVQGLAISDRAYQRAARYAATREQGAVIGMPAGTAIEGHPDVRRLLLSMSSEISAMRAFNVLVGDLRDRAAAGDAASGALVDFFVPVLKGWFTESAVRIASDAIQVHGGLGFVEETGAAQHYRDARILPIYEGTTAIQANDLVGRKVLRGGGETARAVLGLARERAQALAVGDAAAQRIAERLGRAIDAAERATAALLGFADSPRDAYAVGVPYLQLIARVVGGWMHAVRVEAGGSVTEADFYTAHHLAEVHALAESVAAGEIA